MRANSDNALDCGGNEAQANVITCPVAGVVAEDWFEECDGAGERCFAVLFGEFGEYAVAEGAQPCVHAAFERGGARDEFHAFYAESCCFKKRRVVAG